MHLSHIKLIILFLGGIVFPFLAAAQTPAKLIVQGRIIDAETLSPIFFARVVMPEVSLAVGADSAGYYRIESGQKFTRVRFEALGYLPYTAMLTPDSIQTLDIALRVDAQQLREITVKPKQYRNKNNPAVELIEHVIKHRDENRVTELRTYQDEQYEKVIFGMGNVPKKVKNNRFLRSIRFIWDNTDTTKLAGIPIVPIYLQENIINFYSRNPPKSQKKYIQGTKSVKFRGFLDEEGVDRSLEYLYQGIDIYENFITLVTNQFLSPIANNAPLFYRYYPMDTVEADGRKIVHLAFFPRNKADMLLQGDLYIALDSTYPVTHIHFTINPAINLNWVNHLEVEQGFRRLPSGKWILSLEDYRLYFGITKRGMGVFGQRFVAHSDPQVNQPFPVDTLFRPLDEIVQVPGSDRRDSSYWNGKRIPLNRAEGLTYKYVDSLLHTPLFRFTSAAMEIAIGGYLRAGPKLEIGPINTFYAFNGVEGTRLRFGGRTSSSFSKRLRLEGQATYGFRDERWKFGAQATYALHGTYNRFPNNLLRGGILQDVRIPGQGAYQYQTSTLGTSVVRGANDKFLYSDRYYLQYEREYRNHFSYIAGLERQSLSPAGALRFEPAGGGPSTDKPVIVSRAFVQFRYAPKETFYQGNDYRSTIDMNYIAQVRYSRSFTGFFDGQYALHEVTASIYKYTDLPPFGYNKFYVEAGGVYGKAPYPLLTIHRANQTYIYQHFSYNLMNFLEFISDRYVGLNVTHHFNGFFLNKIPLVKKLKLREIATVKVLYGMVSEQNRPNDDSGLYRFPTYPDGSPITYTLEGQPYVEASVGISNIFKILRIDLVRRFTYLDHPNVVKYGIRGMVMIEF